MWAALPDAFAAELQCVSGVDYVCIDQQHGLVDYADMLAMLRAIEGRGTVPLTRVPQNETWLIGKALDAGVQGVVVPMVSNRADAAKAVAACRYSPKGRAASRRRIVGQRGESAGIRILAVPIAH